MIQEQIENILMAYAKGNDNRQRSVRKIQSLILTAKREERESVIEEVTKAIKIDRDSIFYQVNPLCQTAINEYIAEIFTKIRQYLKTIESEGKDE